MKTKQYNYSIKLWNGNRPIHHNFQTAEELYQFCLYRKPEWFNQKMDIPDLEKKWENVVESTPRTLNYGPKYKNAVSERP